MASKKESVPIFQYAVIGIFTALTLVAVFIFSTGGTQREVGTDEPIHLWGTMKKATMDFVIADLAKTQLGLEQVTYTELDPRTYYTQLVEGIATGQGPDLIFVDHEMMIANWNKIWAIPYQSYPEQIFKQSFAEGGEIFLSGSGVVAIPFLIDPMVMYWNRDIFTTAGISQPPKFWDDFYEIAPKITKVDDELNVLKSAISFGEVSNVTHSKEILSMLLLQAGTPIITFGPSGLESFLSTSFGTSEPPAVSAVRFYTEFSNPIKNVYSWNRSLENSRDAFIAGDLAVYFGFASEVHEITKQNPNLNYEVSEVPQVTGGARRLNYANVTGLAIPNAARNKAGALFLANVLSGYEAQTKFSEWTSLPPVRRDLLALPQETVYWSTVYNAALISKVWHDPAPDSTYEIFKRMVESVSTGATDVNSAVHQASQELDNLLK